MPRLKTYEKHIACLESLWDDEVEDRISVRPMLELISKLNDIRHTYLTCNTFDELNFNLRKVPIRGNYLILYLAFHGSPGKLHLADGTEVDIQHLAKVMGTRFKDWVIHFGSCGVLDVPDNVLTDFVNATNASLLIGYKSSVDWTESSALDLLIFDWLQQYKDSTAFIENMNTSYPDLAKATGLHFYSL